MKASAAALGRSNLHGFHEHALGIHYRQSQAVLAEWVIHDRKSFLAAWESGLSLPNPYDEMSLAGRLNAAAIAADAWAGQDAAEAWAWYLGVLRAHPPAVPADYSYYDAPQIPGWTVRGLAQANVDTAFHELDVLREGARNRLDELVLERCYFELGRWCREQKLADAEERAVKLPYADRTPFLSGLGKPARPR
jgi:hypothetical protein